MSTILFHDDWNKYPKAIVHGSTKNQSFLKIAKLYKEMGVKNHEFPLQLHNRDLLKIDPYNVNITVDEIRLVLKECAENFYYFIREVARVPAVASPVPPPFMASRGNMALYWLFHNHIMQFLFMIRQTGKSVGTEILHTYNANIGCSGTEINIVTQNETSRSKLMARLKAMDEALPFYLRARKSTEPANSEIIQIGALNNSIRCHISNTSEALAYKVGRGFTSPIFHGDEVVYVPNVKIAITSALAAGTTARVLAEKNNQPYGTIFTSTTGKKDTKDGKFVYGLMNEAAPWTEMFLDAKNREHLEEMILATTRAAGKTKGYIMVTSTFNHRQLGYTDDWLRKTIKDSLQTDDDCRRDFFNEWTSGTLTSPLTNTETETVRNSQEETVYTEISTINSYTLRWHIPEEDLDSENQKSFWFVGLDPSDASGGDDIGLTLTDARTGAVVAVGNYNISSIPTLCQFFAEILIRFKNTLMIIERRSSGQTIIDYLLLILPKHGIDPFVKLYNTAVQKADTDRETYSEICRPLYARPEGIYDRYKKLFGFATSASGTTSRSELYGTTLQKLVKFTADRIKDSKLIDQLLGLVKRNGRIDHEIGEHDDLVVAWLLTGWLMFHGRNMSHYGIEHRDILSMNETNKVVNSVKSVYDREALESIRMEIEDISEKLSIEKHPIAITKLEQRLRALIPKLPKNEKQTTVNVDSMLDTLNEDRIRNNRIKSWAKPSFSGYSYR